MKLQSINSQGDLHEINLDDLNQVNAEIRCTVRLIEENLFKRRRLDNERKRLRNLLIDLHERRRKVIFGEPKQ